MIESEMSAKVKERVHRGKNTEAAERVLLRTLDLSQSFGFSKINLHMNPSKPRTPIDFYLFVVDSLCDTSELEGRTDISAIDQRTIWQSVQSVRKQNLHVLADMLVNICEQIMLPNVSKGFVTAVSVEDFASKNKNKTVRNWREQISESTERYRRDKIIKTLNTFDDFLARFIHNLGNTNNISEDVFYGCLILIGKQEYRTYHDLARFGEWLGSIDDSQIEAAAMSLYVFFKTLFPKFDPNFLMLEFAQQQPSRAASQHIRSLYLPAGLKGFDITRRMLSDWYKPKLPESITTFEIFDPNPELEDQQNTEFREYLKTLQRKLITAIRHERGIL